MDKEEFFERMLNRIAKDYGYDVASTLELLYMTKEKEIKDLQQRIEKAVEILYKRKHVENLLGGVENSNTDKIINILKGDDTNDR